MHTFIKEVIRRILIALNVAKQDCFINGIRVSAVELEIFTLLHSSSFALTVPEISSKLKDRLSDSTLYNVLMRLNKLGLIDNEVRITKINIGFSSIVLWFIPLNLRNKSVQKNK